MSFSVAPASLTIVAAHANCLRDESGYCDRCKVRSLAVCAALGPDELADLDVIARHQKFSAKTPFIDQDDQARSVFTVTEGAVRLYKLTSDGRRQIIGFALPGDFLGLTVSERYGFSADAIDDVLVCQFARTDFERLVSAKPHLLKKLHEYTTHELVLAQEQMMLLGRRSAEERVATFILTLRDRWARINGAVVNVPMPMQRLDIADYLGLTIETVSRTFSRFTREKMILNVPDGVRLLDPTRLAALTKP
jgi:CRP/FNR family transcriptional regulator